MPSNLSASVHYGRVFATTEELEKPVQGKIEGTIPSWLSGSFFRVGPGKFDFPKSGFTVNNFLDGFAILSKFEFSDGRVTYLKKFLKSDALSKAENAGRPVLPEAHTCCSPDPSKGMFRRLLPSLVPDMSDNTIHNLYTIGTTLFVSNESYHLWSIDPNDLSTLKRYDTTKLLGLNQATAHPLPDHQSESGDLYSWGCTMSATGGKYSIIKIPSAISSSKNNNSNNNNNSQTKSKGNKLASTLNDDDSAALKAMKKSSVLTTISPWSVKLSSFLHTAGITENYLVLIEQPFFTNLTKVAKSIAFGKNYCCSDWVESPMEEMSNRFYIIDKRTGVNLSQKFEILSKAPFIFSHVVNCYEDPKDKLIVVDIACYKDGFIYGSQPLNLTSLRENGLFELENGAIGHRFVIPTSLLQKDFDEKELKKLPENQNLLTSNISEFKIERFNDSEWKGLEVGRETNKIILTPSLFTSKCFETPTINRNFLGKKYRFAYSTGGLFKNHAYDNSVIKVNLETGEIISYTNDVLDANFLYGEPYFIKNPNAVQNKNEGVPEYCSSEDDGILLVAVNALNGNDGAQNYLLILNAKDLVEIGRANFDTHLPPSLHGLFVAHEN